MPKRYRLHKFGRRPDRVRGLAGARQHRRAALNQRAATTRFAGRSALPEPHRGAVQLPSCFIVNAGGPCTTWPLVHGGFALDGRCSIFSHAISSAPPRWMPRPRPTALFPTGLGAGFDPLDRHALHQNPAENIRRCPCDSWLSNRMFASYQDTLEECCQSGVARLVENW